MYHDSSDCICLYERCIMSPFVSEIPTQWSTCSLSYLQESYNHGLDFCLRY